MREVHVKAREEEGDFDEGGCPIAKPEQAKRELHASVGLKTSMRPVHVSNCENQQINDPVDS